MEKQVISAAAFQKKVEIESAHLQYFNYMKKEEADKKARDTVGAQFEVERMPARQA